MAVVGGGGKKPTGKPAAKQASKPKAQGRGKGNRTPRAPQAVAEVEAALKVTRAMALRRQGKTYDQIAREVGYNDRAAAHKAIHAALQAMPTPDAKEWRKLENDRLDELLAVALPLALSGELSAIDRVLRIMERRARLLNLDLSLNRDATDVDRDVHIYIVRRDATPESAALPPQPRVIDADDPDAPGDGEGDAGE